MVAVTDALRAKVARAGAKLNAATAARVAAVKSAKKVATDAHEAGMSDSELAQLLGVDRARTIRRWLGKMDD